METDVTGAIISIVLILLMSIIMTAILIVSMWKIYKKADENGWASIIPVYNILIFAKITMGNPIMGLLLFLPCIGIIFQFIMYAKLAKVFGKGKGFALGIIFLPFIFLPILAFGDAEYTGTEEKVVIL